MKAPRRAMTPVRVLMYVGLGLLVFFALLIAVATVTVIADPEWTAEETPDVVVVTPAETAPAPSETPEDAPDLTVSYADIFREYAANELRAEGEYKGNRYRITAEINGMETGGLMNLTGGATLTMETRVDSTRVFFYAEFEKDQEDALKAVNVGDTITFEGECLSWGSWSDCVLVEEAE